MSEERETTPEILRKVEVGMDKTANCMHYYAVGLIVIIFLLLICGGVVVYTAGFITQKDSTYLVTENGDNVVTEAGDKIVVNDADKNKQQNWIPPSVFIHTSITRFGILLVIIYLVKILFGVTRYVMRLGAYAGARREALLLTQVLTEDQIEAMGLLAEILAAEKLDMGNEPTTPIEQLTKVLEAARAVTK
ncbi:MAG: hypothetical protein P4L99_01325 [Chthoniobacter sp.]|nr:hypothetical protein [Chthoniobacter sp.]